MSRRTRNVKHVVGRSSHASPPPLPTYMRICMFAHASFLEDHTFFRGSEVHDRLEPELLLPTEV